MSRKKGAANIAALRRYLDSVDVLPAKDGKVSVTAVAEAAGIDRLVLYRNPAAKALLEEAAAAKELAAIGSREVPPAAGRAERLLEKRVRELETRNAALAAENADLRARLRAFGHMEDMLTGGRRVIP